MIKLTEKAARKIVEFAEAEGLKLQVRARAQGGGCSGLVFDLEFADVVSDELDFTCESNGITIVVDQISSQFLEEATIDYIDNLVNAGFVFNVPQAKTSCGCQKSFGY